MMCAKDKDDGYCALNPAVAFMMESRDSDASNDDSSDPNFAPGMCSFCGQKMLGAALSVIPDREERKKNLRQMVGFCVKKPGDTKFCGAYIGIWVGASACIAPVTMPQ